MSSLPLRDGAIKVLRIQEKVTARRDPLISSFFELDLWKKEPKGREFRIRICFNSEKVNVKTLVFSTGNNEGNLVPFLDESKHLDIDNISCKASALGQSTNIADLPYFAISFATPPAALANCPPFSKLMTCASTQEQRSLGVYSLLYSELNSLRQMKIHRNEEMIAANKRTLQRYLYMSERRHDSRLQDLRRSIDIQSLQLQFLTRTYNPADSYVLQPSVGMDEDDEDNNEFTPRHHHILAPMGINRTSIGYNKAGEGYQGSGVKGDQPLVDRMVDAVVLQASAVTLVHVVQLRVPPKTVSAGNGTRSQVVEKDNVRLSTLFLGQRQSKSRVLVDTITCPKTRVMCVLHCGSRNPGEVDVTLAFSKCMLTRDELHDFPRLRINGGTSGALKSNWLAANGMGVKRSVQLNSWRKNTQNGVFTCSDRMRTVCLELRVARWGSIGDSGICLIVVKVRRANRSFLSVECPTNFHRKWSRETCGGKNEKSGLQEMKQGPY
ncbi:hypothetical protein Scep_004909 [Stephania cephalantha]|uniref:Uncharacterized protein n=1 Tax=Stephania cephalantha TaxID=152367 RepID=A0AAP0PX15_9MAGN